MKRDQAAVAVTPVTAAARARPRARTVAVLAAALLACWMCLTVTPSARAHDVLVSTAPGDGATVAQTPARVVLTFDDPAIGTGTVIRVAGPTGTVSVGPPQLAADTVTQEIQPDAPAGRYTVDWRVTSADGHPATGTFTFTSAAAGTGTGDAPAATGAGNPGVAAPPVQGGSGGTFWLYAGIVVVVILAAGLITTRGRGRR